MSQILFHNLREHTLASTQALASRKKKKSGFGSTTRGAFDAGAFVEYKGGNFGKPSGFGAPAGGEFGGGDLPLVVTSSYSEFARMVRCPADVVVVGSCNYDQIVYVPHFPGAGATIYGTAYATGFGGKGWTFV